jgi:hypothetical protein
MRDIGSKEYKTTKKAVKKMIPMIDPILGLPPIYPDKLEKIDIQLLSRGKIRNPHHIFWDKLLWSRNTLI